ncbi:MAG: hypothetical protein JO199_04415 [Candidatus Eremiobacteraeota bacterium]|nr:hypothetical protein [Candidatus Eremiobacteraeota bacterium]
MPLQNRVTPWGDVVALPGRGLYTGNRGILHDDHRRIVRQWQVRRWITCALEYKGVRRTPMRPRTWTELFFLDEAAALSAGHRPCGECRRDDYRRYRELFERGRGAAGADAMDVVLHEYRLSGRTKRTYREEIARLPDGAYVSFEGKAALVWGSHLHEWSDARYVRRFPRPLRGEFDVLTPLPSVEILRAGYVPLAHPSAF